MPTSIPFKLPSGYRVAGMRCSPTVNVDHLKPFFGELPAPGPVSDVGQAPAAEHEVELLLNRRTVRGRGVTCYLVRWRGHASSDDESLRVEELAHRGTARISWRISTPPSHAAPAAAPLAGLPRSRPLLRPPHGAHAHGARATRGVAPVGFRLDIGLVAPTEVLSGPVLVGRAVLFRRGLGYGSRRGTVARPHPHAAVGPRVSRTSSGHARIVRVRR